uniref:Uncharacterized protein n=1 Tax=Manihot esculenta TaxID=3983 RepID=A0A2C9UI08_MANES
MHAYQNENKNYTLPHWNPFLLKFGVSWNFIKFIYKFSGRHRKIISIQVKCSPYKRGFHSAQWPYYYYGK